MKIRWTDAAVQDFTSICDYIEKHSSGIVARRVALSIHDQIEVLAKFPEYGRKPDTRELVLSGLPYLAIYRIQKSTIEILRILHGAQHWP
jgi:addiction module RelE/StbE family toxin